MVKSALERVGNHQVARSNRFAGLRKAATTWGRAIVIALAFVLQLVLVALALSYLTQWSNWIYAAQLLLGIGVVTYIVHQRMETTYKLAWVIPVLVAPVFGTAFYLLFGLRRTTRKRRALFDEALDHARKAIRLVGAASGLDDRALPPAVRRQITYLETASHYTVFDATGTSYYPLGEEGFEAMLEAIGRARRYVFAEYFIVAEGAMLDRFMAALAEKAAEGVDVRFLYDDLGSFFKLPVDFHDRCKELGISVVAVNPVGLGFTLNFQSRDHRKILVVDGEVAFTGGINIADEYLNQNDRLGHWKDTVIRLTGPGAWGFTVMFLHMWELATPGDVDYRSFVPTPHDDPTPLPARPAQGLVAPFDDSPFDGVSLGLDIHQQLLQAATRTVDIFTPYLIVNDALIEQVRATAKSGVRVRIVTPHIPDKWYVHVVTRSYYRQLVDAGIEIYEYTPGFIHAKSMLVDDDLAIVGTINMDFRSLFLHQECAVWVHQTPGALEALRRDVEETIAVSQRITEADLDRGIPKTVLAAVLGVFAPLM